MGDLQMFDLIISPVRNDHLSTETVVLSLLPIVFCYLILAEKKLRVLKIELAQLFYTRYKAINPNAVGG